MTEHKRGNEGSGKRAKDKSQKPRHYFFLNPYDDCAFSKCPKCDKKTMLRKFPLAIHIEPAQLFFLNKECRYCVNCDIIITRKSEVEDCMIMALENKNPDIIGNDSVVFGTLDKSDWRKQIKKPMDTKDAIDMVYIFKDVFHFELEHAGWYRTKN